MAYEICHLVISFMLFSDISRSFVSCALLSFPWHTLCYLCLRDRWGEFLIDAYLRQTFRKQRSHDKHY